MEGLSPIVSQPEDQSRQVQTARTYLGIAHGRVTHKERQTGQTEMYESVSGIITGIREREAEFGGKKVSFYEVYIHSDSMEYVLSVNRDSGVARSLVNSLASVQDFSKMVVIKPWETAPDEKGRTFTNVNVYIGSVSKENKMPWAMQLPKVEYQTVGRNTVADDTARFNAIQQLVNAINSRISGESNH